MNKLFFGKTKWSDLKDYITIDYQVYFLICLKAVIFITKH